MSRVVVVGSGIVGLAVAQRLIAQGDEVVLLEKEGDLARHQTGRNSGVIHSGLYYKPGSAKATMCRAGAQSMRAFAEQKGVAFDVPGKLVVAVSDSQLGQLEALAGRATANGVPSRIVSRSEAQEYEPNVKCVSALRVETTGIVDYVGVCRALADEVTGGGGQIRFNEPFLKARTTAGGIVISTSRDEFEASYLVNCAGLYSDRVAAASGVVPDVRIVPFRGEYFELSSNKQDLVKGLIYPLPDPRFPFLGVHLTKMIDGSVHAGPNAVLALAREGYRWRDINFSELTQSLTWPGLWRLGSKNIVPGAQEMLRSASRALFARSLAELVPGIHRSDLVPAKAGVRAQALNRDGTLVDDFFIQHSPRQMHVLNAPSPAATCAFEIARKIVGDMKAVAA